MQVWNLVYSLIEKDDTFQSGKRDEDKDFHLAIGRRLCWGKRLKNVIG